MSSPPLSFNLHGHLNTMWPMYAQYTGAKQECPQWNSGDEVKAVDVRDPTGFLSRTHGRVM